MSGLTLQLLGPPSASVSRAPPGPGMGAAKNLALLAYLALEPGSHSRESLAALLWGESPEQAARASLRQALRRLRAAVGDDLRIGHGTVELRGPVECDVTAFLATAHEHPERAAGFDVPRFLSGLSLRHARGFEEWADLKRRDLLRRYEDVLRVTTRQAIADSRWRDAVSGADRWLACDPLSEEATRLAMEAHYLDGDCGAALGRFATYRARLAQDIGAQPAVPVVELAQRIESEARAERRTPPAELETPVPSFQASLVGRDGQWRALAATWRAVVGGTGLRGRGYDAATGIPYGPVVEALRGALAAPGLGGAAPEWLTEALRLVPELRQRFPTLPEPAAPADLSGRARLFEAVAQLVLAVAAERPSVLFIDDLHWCDGETCALLHFLTRRFQDSGVGCVATLTPGELERDAPAARLRRALRARPATTVVPLPPLTEDEVWRLIRELARIESPTGGLRFARRVHEVTDGNPFHVIEMLKTLFVQGMLTIEAGTGAWVVAPAASAADYRQLPMAETVRDAIAARVARLPYELRDMLATVAVSGRGSRTDLLSHVHGMSRLRAAALADALVERRLLLEEQGVYRCAHPVIAEVVRELLTPARRRELHRAIALSLVTITASGESAEVAGDIARHAEHSGEQALAYQYALRASEAATARYAFEEALSWLDLASGIAGEGPEADQVNRRTVEVLRLAGWTEPPPLTARRSASGGAIERRDLDLGSVGERA